MRHADKATIGVGVKEKAATNFEVTIDELVLTGFAPGDRFHIADAVERELARLLTERGIPGLDGKSVAMEGLDAGKFKVAGGARAAGIGRQAAQLLHQQLSLQQAGKTPGKTSAKKP
jgi:hypothetical protein